MLPSLADMLMQATAPMTWYACCFCGMIGGAGGMWVSVSNAAEVNGGNLPTDYWSWTRVFLEAGRLPLGAALACILWPDAIDTKIGAVAIGAAAPMFFQTAIKKVRFLREKQS